MEEKYIREFLNRSISIGILSLVDTIDTKCYLTQTFLPIIAASTFTDSRFNKSIESSMYLQKMKRRNKSGHYEITQLDEIPQKVANFVSDIKLIRSNALTLCRQQSKNENEIENEIKQLGIIGDLFHDFVLCLLRIYLKILRLMFPVHTKTVYCELVNVGEETFSINKLLIGYYRKDIRNIFINSKWNTMTLTDLIKNKLFKFGNCYNLQDSIIRKVVKEQIYSIHSSRLTSNKRKHEEEEMDRNENYFSEEMFDYNSHFDEDFYNDDFDGTNINHQSHLLDDQLSLIELVKKKQYVLCGPSSKSPATVTSTESHDSTNTFEEVPSRTNVVLNFDNEEYGTKWAKRASLSLSLSLTSSSSSSASHSCPPLPIQTKMKKKVHRFSIENHPVERENAAASALVSNQDDGGTDDNDWLKIFESSSVIDLSPPKAVIDDMPSSSSSSSCEYGMFTMKEEFTLTCPRLHSPLLISPNFPHQSMTLKKESEMNKMLPFPVLPNLKHSKKHPVVDLST